MEASYTVRGTWNSNENARRTGIVCKDEVERLFSLSYPGVFAEQTVRDVEATLKQFAAAVGARERSGWPPG